MSEESLKTKTAKGLFWGGLSNGLQQILLLLFGIVFARILNSEDYGLIGVLSVFIGIASILQEGGFTAGLINRERIHQEDYNAVFWFSCTLGAFFYLILFFSAPFIADFFNEPILVKLSRVLFLSFLINSFGVSHNAILLKKMKVKERAIIDIVSPLISYSIGIFMVWRGFGYWGLAIQTVIYSFISVLLRCYYSSWSPSLSFRIQPLKEMFPFSIKLVLTNLVTQINTNLITVFMGRFYAMHDVGNYTQGNKWASMGSLLVNNMLLGIAQPILVESNENIKRQINVFLKMLRFLAFVSFPIMFGLSFVSNELIIMLITEKWLSSIPIMQILCIWGAFLPFQTICIQLIISRGKSNVYLWNTIGFGIAQIILLLIFHSFGIYTMVYIFVGINFFWLFVWFYFASRMINLKIIDIGKAIFPYFAITLFVLICAFLFTKQISMIYLRLILKILISAILYVIINWKMNSVIFRDVLVFLFRRK